MWYSRKKGDNGKKSIDRQWECVVGCGVYMKSQEVIMDSIVEKYNYIRDGSDGWIYANGDAFKSLGEYMMYICRNRMNGVSIRLLDERMKRGGYYEVVRYFMRYVRWSNLIKEGGVYYVVSEYVDSRDVLSDPWGRLFIKYRGEDNLEMIKKMNINVNEYEGMEVNDVDGRVICSVELTSVEGYTVYCLHVYGYETKDDKV